jgi:uncharacterized protein (TIGR03085 family)
MTADPLDARERRELCDLLVEVGPDAPTLCEGWRAVDLAAHLVVREREPVAAAGILVPAMAARTEQRQAELAAGGLDPLVDRIRSGPPLVPFGLPGVRTAVNLLEYTVHHEDVRRPNGHGPRGDRPDLQDALWRLLGPMARIATRGLRGAGLELVRPDGTRRRARSGEPTATLTGEPVELALYLTGRRSAALVDLGGPADAVAAVEAADLGL